MIKSPVRVLTTHRSMSQEKIDISSARPGALLHVDMLEEFFAFSGSQNHIGSPIILARQGPGQIRRWKKIIRFEEPGFPAISLKKPDHETLNAAGL